MEPQSKNYPNNDPNSGDLANNNNAQVPEEIRTEISLEEYRDSIIPPEKQEAPVEGGQLAKKIGGAALVGQDEDISFYTFGIEAVEERFDHEASERVKNELLRIKTIEHETIGALESRGELSAQDRATMNSLVARGVNAANLTPVEANLVYDYATNATPEIVKHKAERLVDNINKRIDYERRSNNESDSIYSDREIFNFKAELNDRFEAWGRGEVDVERGFDIEKAYKKAIENGYEDTTYLRRELENGEREELMAEGLIDESSCYVLGLPITEEELGEVQLYSSSKYTDITSSRSRGGYKKGSKTEYGRELKRQIEQLDPNDHSNRAKSIRIAYDAWNKRHPSVGETEKTGTNLSTLVGSEMKQITEHTDKRTGKKSFTFEIIGNTIGSGPSNIEQDLLCDFVAGEILQSRRLRSKEMLTYSSALAIKALDEISKPEDEDKKVDYDAMRRSLSFLGYYSAQMLGFKREELKARYGSIRPIKKEFFEEIASSAEQITDRRADYLNNSYKEVLTKMDEHMFNALLSIEALKNENQFMSDEWD